MSDRRELISDLLKDLEVISSLQLTALNHGLKDYRKAIEDLKRIIDVEIRLADSDNYPPNMKVAYWCDFSKFVSISIWEEVEMITCKSFGVKWNITTIPDVVSDYSVINWIKMINDKIVRRIK